MNIRTTAILLAIAATAAIPVDIAAQSSRSASSTMSKIAEKNIIGTVRDSEGEPLVGATVMIEGTSQGVATDADGNFSILSARKNPVLLISYIGM